MGGRRANGEGTIYRRKDGRWEGAAYVLAASGKRKRIRVYGKTRSEVHGKLTDFKAQEQRGIRAPDHAWRLDEYLDYWLREVVGPNRRLSTYERYEVGVRLYLKPGLGHYRLKSLSVPIVQAFLNQRLDAGGSIRSVQILREILRSALSRAYRDELVSRNVASLVELPTWERRDIEPWTTEEARQFLSAARSDSLYPAFVLLVLYGLRRGEVLGLRWGDIDFVRSMVRVRQQVRRVGGELRQGPVKTAAGRRDLPMLDWVRQVLTMQRGRSPDGPYDGDELVFRTSTGQPIEPRNFVRSFQRVCDRHAIRLIRVHDVRHTTATLLKDLGVPARDTQLILGHSDIAITQQIYQHDTLESRRASLGRVEAVLRAVDPSDGDTQAEEPGYLEAVIDGNGSRQFSRQTREFVDRLVSITSGTPGRTRTYDTWFRSSADSTLNDRLTSVTRSVRRHRRQRLLGVVAVNLAVNYRANSPCCGVL
jgi:integrase